MHEIIVLGIGFAVYGIAFVVSVARIAGVRFKIENVVRNGLNKWLDGNVPINPRSLAHAKLFESSPNERQLGLRELSASEPERGLLWLSTAVHEEDTDARVRKLIEEYRRNPRYRTAAELPEGFEAFLTAVREAQRKRRATMRVSFVVGALWSAFVGAFAVLGSYLMR